VPFFATIGTSLGVIGFVTFIGGMIVWARAHAIGIPAAPTLGVFPSQDLLVIGAETLVPLVLTALAVVGFVTGIYALARNLIPKVEELLTHHEDQFLAGDATQLTTTGMFLLVFVALLFPLVQADLSSGQLIPATVGIAVGAAVGAAVGKKTPRFTYFAATTFVLAGVFLGFVAYWSATNDIKVRGAAIIRNNTKAIAGIFVAEGAGRVYRARLKLDKHGKINRSNSRLIAIAKNDVTDIAIADRQRPKQANAQARRLAKELCELQLERPAPTGGRIQNCKTAPAGKPQP
jgi:hypothetical protein